MAWGSGAGGKAAVVALSRRGLEDGGGVCSLVIGTTPVKFVEMVC